MKVLIVGESWHTFHTHVKGFDPFFNSTYDTGVTWLKNALEDDGIEVVYIPNHTAGVDFPTELKALQEFDVILLSDIGSNTLLLHPDTFTKSIRTPNRLKLLREYVEKGGGLGMIGGYLTFQGIDAKGQWKGTPVEEVLPVNMLQYDDRVEVPEGFHPEVVKIDHPILKGMDTEWPWFLGYNQLSAKPGADVLLKRDEDVFVAVQEYGSGRTFAFASDCAPHWGPPEFVEWEHYPRFWVQAVKWLARKL